MNVLRNVIVYFVYSCIYVLHQNINGLINKSDNLIINLDNLEQIGKNVGILCITEHNMASVDLDRLSIANFKLVSVFVDLGVVADLVYWCVITFKSMRVYLVLSVCPYQILLNFQQ